MVQHNPQSAPHLTYTGQAATFSMAPCKGALQRLSPLPPLRTRAQSVAWSCFICEQVLGGKFTFQTWKNQCLGWQQYSGNRSNKILSYILIFHKSVCPIAAQHTVLNTTLQQFLKMSQAFLLYKISMLWRTYGSRKSFSRNVTEQYFQPSCSTWQIYLTILGIMCFKKIICSLKIYLFSHF